MAVLQKDPAPGLIRVKFVVFYVFCDAVWERPIFEPYLQVMPPDCLHSHVRMSSPGCGRIEKPRSKEPVEQSLDQEAVIAPIMGHLPRLFFLCLYVEMLHEKVLRRWTHSFRRLRLWRNLT